MTAFEQWWEAWEGTPGAGDMSEAAIEKEGARAAWEAAIEGGLEYMAGHLRGRAESGLPSEGALHLVRAFAVYAKLEREPHNYFSDGKSHLKVDDEGFVSTWEPANGL